MARKKPSIKGKKMTQPMNAEELDFFNSVLKKKPTEESLTGYSSLVVVGDERELNSFKDIRVSKRSKPKEKSSISEWNNTDLLRHFRSRYYDAFRLSYSVPPSAGCASLATSSEKIAAVRGIKTTPFLMKQYIDWFFDNIAKDIMSRGARFDIALLSRNNYIVSFVHYVQTSAAVEETKPIENEGIYNMEAMDRKFAEGKESFLIDYGLVLTVAYLVHRKKVSEQIALKIVHDVVVALISKDINNFATIKSATEDPKVYPHFCNFNLQERLFGDLTRDTKISFLSLKMIFSSVVKRFDFIKES